MPNLMVLDNRGEPPKRPAHVKPFVLVTSRHWNLLPDPAHREMGSNGLDFILGVSTCTEVVTGVSPLGPDYAYQRRIFRPPC